MPKYVDGFVLVVPKDKKDAYTKMANEGKETWMRHGALQYFECRGTDLKHEPMEGMEDMDDMQAMTFVELAKPGPNEEVWFSFIIFNSKEHRDEVNGKVMAEMGEKQDEYKDMEMPFEMKKMAYGGFSVEVEG